MPQSMHARPEPEAQAGAELRTYRLVSDDPALGNPRVEFQATSVYRAIEMMQTLCGLHEVEMFEGEQSLGRLRLAGAKYWIVSGR